MTQRSLTNYHPQVGAGPSGLVLALTLLKHDINVRVIDKSPSPQKGSRGSGVMVGATSLAV